MNESIGAIIGAVIGVSGTLLGTVLGWILNNLSSKGKLRIYYSKWNGTFTSRAFGAVSSCNDIKKAECYRYQFLLDVFNSSAQSKIMRELYVVFYDGKKVICANAAKDKNSLNGEKRILTYSDFPPITIPPKTVLQLSLVGSVGFDMVSQNDLMKTKKIVLEYKNEKNQKKRVPLIIPDFTKYALDSKKEEPNGQA